MTEMTPELLAKQKGFFDTIAKALRDEGFEVRDHHGLPLALTPATLEAKKKLLDMKLPVYAEMRIFKGGALFVPGDPHGS